jgi:hypothetical protein
LAKRSAAAAGGEMTLAAREESATSASGDIVEVKDIDPSLAASSERCGKVRLRSVECRGKRSNQALEPIRGA